MNLELPIVIQMETMSKLFVDKTIEIDALPFKVWDVLTKPEYNNQWASESDDGAPFRIESDWHIAAPVRWHGVDSQVVVEGNVTRFEPEKLLRFTVFDVRSAERPPVTEEDGITLELNRHDARTFLRVRQGDFSVMSDGEKYRQLSANVWDGVLPKIKQLAAKPVDKS